MVSVKTKSPRFGNATLLFLLGLFSILSVFVGVHSMSVTNLRNLNEVQHIVLFSTRIPRTVSLILAGSTLSVSGLLMQHMTQNRFVSPSTAGTMASARLGVIISIIFFSQASVIHKTLIAFVFAVVGTLLFTSFLRTIRLKKTIMVPLVGIMFGNIISSLSSYLAVQYEVVQNASSWLQGNFALISSKNYQLLFLTLPVLIVISCFAHYFTIMGLGKEMSSDLGISYPTFEIMGIVLVSLATASVILTVGSIPFVGIVVPNVISLKKGDHFGKIVVPTALLGALFLIVTDIFSRLVIFPYELPISIVISVIGSLLFLYLLLRGENKYILKEETNAY